MHDPAKVVLDLSLAWVHRGEPKVAFDFTVVDGIVSRIDFRADPVALERVRARKGNAAR